MACGVGFSGRPGLFSPYALKIQEQLTYVDLAGFVHASVWYP